MAIIRYNYLYRCSLFKVYRQKMRLGIEAFRGMVTRKCLKDTKRMPYVNKRDMVKRNWSNPSDRQYDPDRRFQF
jgi:hypothetical protein